MRACTIRHAERIAADHWAWAKAWNLAIEAGRCPPPEPYRGDPRDGDFRLGFNAAWLESDREHGRVWALEDLAVPPQTAMGLAGWLYYLMQRGHES